MALSYPSGAKTNWPTIPSMNLCSAPLSNGSSNSAPCPGDPLVSILASGWSNDAGIDAGGGEEARGGVETESGG